MMTCGSCGRQVEGDFPFCPYCRAELAPRVPIQEQRKHVTILFCDVTGSTALGESTDPEALRAILARYFERMKGIIESHGGAVEKFIGDAVMAVFGVPVVHEDDALRAVRAAREMQEALPGLGVQARIGVNTGEVVTGTAERLATGDAVNVAARLEQAASPGVVLIGEETFRLVRDAVRVEGVPSLELKGKSRPVVAYRLLDVKETGERRQPSASMIGRERELDRLTDALAQAAEDRSCQLFTVLGTAGVGKSRLVMEFLDVHREPRVVRGRCLSYGEGITYWPVAEIVRQLDVLPDDEYAAAILRSILGEARVATSPEESAWAFRTLLEERAQDEPLVVVFDDIHWGDEGFLDLIEHVADLSRDAPILLLCMARLELLERRPGWGGGKWNATTVLLEPLNARETDRLLDALSSAISDEVRERIREAAEGNPLFVEELLALMEESGSTRISIPPTIQALMAARVDQLPPDERQVMECGAVEGRVFHRGAVQALTQEVSTVPGRLVRLVRKDLIRPDSGQIRGDEAYRFRHLLIRDAAYEALPKARRAELHEEFARWLDERGQDLPELDEIAGFHLEQATRYVRELGQPHEELADRAGERLASAGRKAVWFGDQGTAAGLLERALELRRPIRLDLYLELDLLDSLALSPEERIKRLEVLAEQARQTGDQLWEAVARMAVVLHLFRVGAGGSVAELEDLGRFAVRLAQEREDHQALTRVWSVLAYCANTRCHYGEMTQAAESAIQQARSSGLPGLFGLPTALVNGPRPADEAITTLDLYLADEPHPSPRLARSNLLAMLGRFDEARAESAAASERMRDLGRNEAEWAWQLAYTSTLAGDHQEAADSMGLFCAWLTARGDLALLSTYAPMLGRSLCALGRYEEAEPLARRGRELSAEDDITSQALWRQVQAQVLGHSGELAEAERLARDAVAILEQTDALNAQAGAVADLAEVLQMAGKQAEAVAALDAALDLFERKRNVAMAVQLRQQMEVAAIPGADSTPPKRVPST